MRVVYWGTYDTSKPRTRILRDGLRLAGVALEEIHASVWEGIEDKSQLRGAARKARIALNWALAYPGLLWRLWRTPRPDLILVGYPGQVDVFLAALVGWLRGVPVVWDVFLSAYDTVCMDRRLLRPDGLAGKLMHWLEGRAIRSADLAFMDTRAHARRMEALFDLPPGSFGAVWVGVESDCFAPPASPVPTGDRKATRVLFYGQFIPLHGVSVIIEAARQLRGHDIDWQLVGRGQDADQARAMLADTPLPRVAWVDWVPYRELKDWIHGADLCLGIFGTSAKAASVIPNKVFQMVAAGRPLVTRDGPAIREFLSPAAGCSYLVAAGDPGALAEAVLEHHHARLAGTATGACHAGMMEHIEPAAIGRQFLHMIERHEAAP